MNLIVLGTMLAAGQPGDWAELERQFVEMPMEARRLTGPLFWLHGDDNETPERLAYYVEKVFEGNNGTLCAESRPHSDWLGPRWFKDVDVCLETAKRLDLKLWIFDDAWWPSQTMGRRVPPEYAAKRLVAEAVAVEGPARFTGDGYGGDRFVAAVAGLDTGDGIDPDSLVNLAPFIRDGSLEWDAPAGAWSVMKFTWEVAPVARQNGQLTVDGASQDCVDWFVDTVYQPHYDRYKEDFGDTIVGFFYDEPETQGDWGTELGKMFAERGVDPKKAMVAWKFELAGEAHAAMRYAYYDAFFETWGRTMYGSMLRWCEERNVASIGHFMDHGDLYLDHGLGAGNLFQMQKYSSMGGMDLVVRQLYPGQRKHDIYQLPKLVSSISHVYAKTDDLTMCEIFGAYGQDLTYPQMKWLADQHQVRGVNFMITHSFNPKAPNDTDCPPYFFNDGHEPRWPLYRVWADYTSRLSLLLTGGRHVCPVAFLFCGNSKHIGRTVTPEDMTTTLQDALFDCDWIPYDVFEEDAELVDAEVALHAERYRILIVPPVEVIPYGALAKVKAFFESGGVVVGYDFLPNESATLGRSGDEITALCEDIWGRAKPGLEVCKTNGAGGRSYFLPEKVSPEDVQAVLTKDAGVHAALEVARGDTHHWLHVLHRVKNGQDVFLICNQDHEGEARRFRMRATAQGVPESWDAMRNEVTAIPFKRMNADTVDFDLMLEPSESVLVVFRPEARGLPTRVDSGTDPVQASIPVERDGPAPVVVAEGPLTFEGCPWVWFPGENAREEAPPGTCYFRQVVTVPERTVRRARFLVTADNAFTLIVNGQKAGASGSGTESWRQPVEVDVTKLIIPGKNTIAIAATNATDNPSPAGLIGSFFVEYDEGAPMSGRIDSTWKTSNKLTQGWDKAGFDDQSWPDAGEIAKFGEGPWGRIGQAGAIRPADPFRGSCALPEGLEPCRVCLEMDGVLEGVSVKVNGAFAGGCIGGPFRLDVTSLVKAGENTFEIEPYAPGNVRLAFYAASSKAGE